MQNKIQMFFPFYFKKIPTALFGLEEGHLNLTLEYRGILETTGGSIYYRWKSAIVSSMAF